MRTLLAALVCLLASPSAFAANTFRSTYIAPESCPSQADFDAAVVQRLPGWKHDAEAERNVVVSIQSANTGFHGSVSLDGAQPREVEGPRCDSVVRALALVTAVSLDPTAALSTEPMSDPAPPTPVPVAPPPTAPPPAPRPPLPTPIQKESGPPSLGFGAGGALLFGPAPSPLYGFQAHVELGTSNRDLLLRLAGARSFTGATPVGSGEARFDLTQGELAGCYLPVRAAISVLTCVITDVGSIQAEGEPSDELVETKTSTRLWAASGGRLGFDFRVAGPLHVESSVGALIPWSKQTYIFDSTKESLAETLYESSPVALDLRLGLTVIFPSGDQE